MVCNATLKSKFSVFCCKTQQPLLVEFSSPVKKVKKDDGMFRTIGDTEGVQELGLMVVVSVSLNKFLTHSMVAS